MQSFDLNCAILSEQIYSEVTPGPWFKRIQCNVSNNSFSPKSNVFKRKNTVWVVYGGSSSIQDVVTNVNFATCSPFDDMDCGLKVHAGMWTNLKDLMLKRIVPCLESNIARCETSANKVDTIVLTGHSLGGAYAILARFFLAFSSTVDESLFRGIDFHVVTFGAPLVFACEKQARVSSKLGGISKEIRNYVSGCDIVPRLLGGKLRDWRRFVSSGFRGGKGLGAGLAAAGAVLLNSGTGGMAMSAAVLGSGFYAYFSTNKFGGVKQMAIAQLCAAPKLRDKWLRMLESEEAQMYFPVGIFFFLERGERVQRFEQEDRNAVMGMLEVPEGYDAYAKSIKQHQIEEYRQLISLTLPMR